MSKYSRGVLLILFQILLVTLHGVAGHGGSEPLEPSARMLAPSGFRCAVSKPRCHPHFFESCCCVVVVVVVDHDGDMSHGAGVGVMILICQAGSRHSLISGSVSPSPGVTCHVSHSAPLILKCHNSATAFCVSRQQPAVSAASCLVAQCLCSHEELPGGRV